MATTTALTTYASNKVLDLLLRATTWTPPSNVYVALFTTATDDSGGGTEATGGSYARQAASFEVAGTTLARQSGTDAPLDWANMPADTFTHLALYDAASAGNMLAHGELDASVTTGSGDPLSITAGDLIVEFLTGALTTYAAEALLDHMLRSSSYSPAATIEQALLDNTDTEVTGGSYARQTIAFDAAAASATANAGATSFTAMPAVTVKATALHEDTAGGGNALFVGDLTTPRAITAGGAVDFDAGDVKPGIN